MINAEVLHNKEKHRQNNRRKCHSTTVANKAKRKSSHIVEWDSVTVIPMVKSHFQLQRNDMLGDVAVGHIGREHQNQNMNHDGIVA